jgi:hypothetical protein
MTKLYLHQNSFSLTSGTLPSGEQDAAAPNFSATGAGTLREMNAIAGSASTYLSASTQATTSNQSGFLGMWASPPLAGAQTVGGGSESLTINIADYQSNLAANFCVNRAHAYVWRPSTGLKVGDLCTFTDTPLGAPAEATGAASAQVTTFSLTLASIEAADGDILVVELWTHITQDAASSYEARLYYDGVTESLTENTVVSDHAAFVEFSQTLAVQAPETRLTQQGVYAVYDAATEPETRLTQQGVYVVYDAATEPEVHLTQQAVYLIYVPPPPPIDLEGSTADQVSASGELSTSIDMGGQAANQVSATGNLLTAILFEGHAEAHTEAHAELTQKKLFKFVINHVGVKGDIDFDTQAARRFYGEVRKFAERTKPWQLAIFYETNPDEIWDLTLVSQRVYGRRDEYLAVMAAAGIDSVDQPLKQKRLVLPTEQQLNLIKRKTGFESIADLREERKPVWLN